jgi:osmoprotectant transport system ATP-binding protein
MDEPFGALDPITRRRLQEEFRKLEQSLGKTVVFVTHDVPEALRLADRIAVLDQGQLRQIGTPREIVEQPADDFVREFVRYDEISF